MTAEWYCEGTSCIGGACVRTHRGGTARRPYGLIVSRGPIFLVPSRLSALHCVPTLFSLSLCLSSYLSISLSIYLDDVLFHATASDEICNPQAPPPTSCLRPSFNSTVLIATPPTAQSQRRIISALFIFPSSFSSSARTNKSMMISTRRGPHTDE